MGRIMADGKMTVGGTQNLGKKLKNDFCDLIRGWRGRTLELSSKREVRLQFLEIAAKNHYFFLLQNPPTTTQLLSRVTVVAHVGYTRSAKRQSLT